MSCSQLASFSAWLQIVPRMNYMPVLNRPLKLKINMIQFFFASKFALFATVFHFFATPPYIFATPPSFFATK
jgi:hypothetical protein